MIWNTPTSDWTWAIDRVQDCTGDGINDVVVGDLEGYFYLLDGLTGAIEWRWLNPTGDKIKTIRSVPDLNGNTAPDMVAGTQLLYGGTGGWVNALEGNRDITAAPESESLACRLSEGYLNPTSSSVAWRISLDQPGLYGMLILGANGRCVRQLGGESLAPGSTSAVSWVGRDADGTAVPGA